MNRQERIRRRDSLLFLYANEIGIIMSKIKDIERQCTAMRNNGIKCTMIRMHDAAYCYTHNPDPEVSAKRKISLRHGQSRRFAMNNHGSSARLENMHDVKKRYAEIFNELRLADGDREIKKNADKMIAALKGFTEAYEKSDLNQKVDSLLEKLEERKEIRDSQPPTTYGKVTVS
jgi:hypothetical protein